MKMVEVTGNTYPVKEQLKALGGKLTKKNDKWIWLIPEDRLEEARKIIDGIITTKPQFRKCQVCGVVASQYCKILHTGECHDCFEERKTGY